MIKRDNKYKVNQTLKIFQEKPNKFQKTKK